MFLLRRHHPTRLGCIPTLVQPSVRCCTLWSVRCREPEQSHKRNEAAMDAQNACVRLCYELLSHQNIQQKLWNCRGENQWASAQNIGILTFIRTRTQLVPWLVSRSRLRFRTRLVVPHFPSVPQDHGRHSFAVSQLRPVFVGRRGLRLFARQVVPRGLSVSKHLCGHLFAVVFAT